MNAVGVIRILPRRCDRRAPAPVGPAGNALFRSLLWQAPAPDRMRGAPLPSSVPPGPDSGVRSGKARPCAHWPSGRSLLRPLRSEEHTSELQSLMRISYAVFCLKKKNIRLVVHVFSHIDPTSRITYRINRTYNQMSTPQ